LNLNPGKVSDHLELIGNPEEGWEEVGGVIILVLYVMVAALLKLMFHHCSGPPFAVPECVLLICTGLLIGTLLQNSRHLN
jgi:predicted Abi (CAAX) family protease